MADNASNKRPKAITGGGTASEISPVAELISSNADLLTEIFLRLPAKSLLRFKSVSKHWLSLITHSQFSTCHSIRNPRPSISGLYFYTHGRLESVSLHGRQSLPSLAIAVNGSKPRILHSCNGLLLCKASSRREPIYIVCNPTTQKYKLVPKPTGLSYRLYVRRGAYLAFDPSKSPHYKVVLGSRYSASKREPWCFEIDMYDSETGNWKKILPPSTCCGRGVFWNGAIHWLSYKKVLLRFEVDAEKMVALPLPRRSPRILPQNRVKYFGECGGGLILIQTRSLKDTRFAILEWGSDTNRWIVKYLVKCRTIVSVFPEMRFFEIYVLCVVKSEEKEDYKLVLAIPGKVISYNLKCNTMDVLRDLVPGALLDHDENCYAYPFAETLSPV
ncbi:hypothetical protein RHSIM_Rhsim08G0168000 [Rhododendron simsii]|uniref:F-box protein n=1 Tax=Rhododendron simsii TaxID=118357 RepID=A0A834GNW9_RHOSS|nr:hypothetical protein RHSIM_Rhsim08G0168000 [Rhododendron simsii]